MITGPITAAERSRVRALWREGRSRNEIASEMGRATSTVGNWLNALKHGRELIPGPVPIDPETRATVRSMTARGVGKRTIARELDVSEAVVRRIRKADMQAERRATGDIRRVVRIPAGGPNMTECERESGKSAKWFRELTRDWAGGRPAGWWWA